MKSSAMINLIPYLPQETVMPQKRSRRRFTLSELVECGVTVCLGIAVLFVLAFFVAAL